ncbi:MAG: hypothetical protein GC154_05335 [bacterium]|nr:hypothetical protein [bacterium]
MKRLLTCGGSVICLLLACSSLTWSLDGGANGRFVNMYWYEQGAEYGNPKFNTRFRVNSPEASLDESFGQRVEARANGMMQILMEEDLRYLDSAELYLELWGGHPGTARKRLTINGRSTIMLPEVGTESNNCTHQYPYVPLKISDLVNGYNAIQFACDRGSSFWGHFIVDNACIFTVYKDDHPLLKQEGLAGAAAHVKSTLLPGGESYRLSAEIPDAWKDRVRGVMYQTQYFGYDENGDGNAAGWHGFSKGRRPVAFAGFSAEGPDYGAVWDASMLPDQTNMKVRAYVMFDSPSGVSFITPSAALPPLVRERVQVEFIQPVELPRPFWSRANQKKSCVIELDADPAQITRAQLHIAVWDGGHGNVADYFTLNGHPLAIAGDGRHDVIYSTIDVNPSWLKTGENRFELLSDTEHHGIEILLPGPMLVIRTEDKSASSVLPIDRWHYVQLDDSRGKWGDEAQPDWLRYFGIDMGDADGDGDLDVVSGRYFYRNPGGDMTAPWPRADLGLNADAIFLTDVDGDDYADVIAQALPKVYWLEAENNDCTQWSAEAVAELPPTDHINSQGFEKAQIIPGGRPELLIASGDGIYCLEIPADPHSSWPKVKLTSNTSSEGIGVGDIDGDGDVDIAASPETQDYVAWWENPGPGAGGWLEHRFGATDHDADRIEVFDMNGDGRLDVVISEERYPGKEPDAMLVWFEQPADAKNADWPRHDIVTEYSLNNLDVADLDRDGDMDIVTNEHKGPDLRVQVWENDGAGRFAMHEIDRGHESHLGSQLADLDGDGDLDMVSPAWDNWRYLHLWRNDAVK